MPNTFLIKDILNNKNDEVVINEFNKRPVSPLANIKHFKKAKIIENEKFLVLPENIAKQQQHSEIQNNPYLNNELLMNSLISIANQQQLNINGIDINSNNNNNNNNNNTDIYLKSPKSSSSSSSLSSTSPISSTSSFPSIYSQFSHEQLINQFYQRLLFLNLQNSLSKIQTNSNNNTVQSAFTSLQKQNKENNNEREYYDHAENSQESLIKVHKRLSSSTQINKSFSTSSLKISDNGEFDESNSDGNHSSNGSCSTPIENTSNTSNVSPLDALLQMANTTFTSNLSIRNQHHDKYSKLNLETQTIPLSSSNDNIPIKSTNPILTNKSNQNHIHNDNDNNDSLSKRKRKNRTAFTAHQIYELEKRFSMQKYLSPNDRDRISQELSLSTAQVITWFQNRRAKQKRDVEEMKNDLLASKNLCGQSIIDEQSSNCSYSNHNNNNYHHHHHHNKNYSNNNSIENDCCNSVSDDLSMDSPNTSI